MMYKLPHFGRFCRGGLPLALASSKTKIYKLLGRGYRNWRLVFIKVDGGERNCVMPLTSACIILIIYTVYGWM